MEPPAKRQRISPPAELQRTRESSSSDDDFYAPAPPQSLSEDRPLKPQTDIDDEVEILDEGEEVEDIDEADLHIRRAQSLSKIRSKWDDICEKYGREFENADEIDLNTLKVVVDNGHIAQMQDETDVGNGQPTPRRESRPAPHAEKATSHSTSQIKANDRTFRSPERRKHHDRTSRSPRTRSPHKSDLKRKIGTGRHMAQHTIYEDASSDDDLLYEKPSRSIVALAPRQPQAINQARPRGGSTTVVEKRTVITTRRITTSTIRDDRSHKAGHGNGNDRRQLSHERTSREVQRYSKSSQDKIVDASSDDELVQREQEPERVLQTPSQTRKTSLWAPKQKVGRPRIHHHPERGDHQRHVSRRDRVVVLDANGNKVRKQRSDKGIQRVPDHLRKTHRRNNYVTDSLGSESSNIGGHNVRPHLYSDRTDSSTSVPNTTAEEATRSEIANPVLFTRNTVDKSYDFSDEEDDAVPPNATARPPLLTVPSTVAFLGQDIANQPSQPYQPQVDTNCHYDQEPNETLFQVPLSPPPPYSELAYPVDTFVQQDHIVGADNYAMPVAPMGTLHEFPPHEEESSGFMDSYVAFPPSASQGFQNEVPAAHIPSKGDAPKYESEDDLSIPIDPALLALDAENRAASLERAQATSDPTDEPGMEGTVVPAPQFKELAECEVKWGSEEDDTDDDLFELVGPDRISFVDAAAVEKPRRREVPDSDAESEDELLTQPSSQPAPNRVLSSQQSSAQTTPRTTEARKRVRFADSVVGAVPSPAKVLPPPPWSPLSDHEDVKPDCGACSPSWQPQMSEDTVDVEVEEDDEDDIALLPASPVITQKPRAISIPPTVAAPSRPDTSTARAKTPAESVLYSRPVIPRSVYNDDDELSTPKSILKRPSASRSTTPQPQPVSHPQNSKLGSRSTSTPTPGSRATPPRLFSLSASVSPQPRPRPKLRSSLLSESASTRPRRIATPSPVPTNVPSGRSRTANRLLSVSPAPSGGVALTGTASGTPVGRKLSRPEIQAQARANRAANISQGGRWP